MIEFKSATWLDTDQLAAAVSEATIEPKKKCAILVEAYAKRSMKQGGKILKKSGKGHLKQGAPSRPGTPPHRQTGIGASNIRYAPIQGRTGEIYLVGPTSPPAGYMRVHEFGGKHHPPRPFMRPALAAVAPQFPQLYRRMPIANTPSGRRLDRRVAAWLRRWRGRI